MRLNFTLYGSQFTYGWLPDGAKLISATGLVREGLRRGFSGIELPARTLESSSVAELRAIRSLADQHDLELIVSAFGTDVEYLVTQVRNAAELKAACLRTVIGGAAYGGDRREFAGGGWSNFIGGVEERLAAVLRVSDPLGIPLAVENHQDAASEDLLHMCTVFENSNFGVVLDVANPLATAEHPVTFARKMLPYIKYVHLKDYRIYWSAEGYRLVRCPVGAGVVPIIQIIDLLKTAGLGYSASLELAALEQRHVRLFEADWWPEYSDRSARELAGTLSFVRAHALPSTEDYRTPYERAEPPEEIKAYEEAELAESIRLMAPLTGDYLPLRVMSGEEPARETVG